MKKKTPEESKTPEEKEVKEVKNVKSQKSVIFKNRKIILTLVFLYLLDFCVKIIVYSVEKTVIAAEKSSERIDDVEVVLDSIKICILYFSIIGIIFAGIVDHYNIILYANIAGLGILCLVVATIGFTIAPFIDVSYKIESVLLYLTHALLYSNIVFEPIRTVLILKHFNLPEKIGWLIIGIGVLMLLRNLAVVIVAVSTSIDEEAWEWVFFGLNMFFLVILLTFIGLLVYFRRHFLFASPIPFLEVLKCYWQAILLKFKKKDKTMYVKGLKWTDRVIDQPEEVREATRLMASIMFVLSLFIIMSTLVQLIYDAYDYQVEIQINRVWIAKLDAEQIVAGMNIINIIFLVIVGVLISTQLNLTSLTDLRKIIASFLCILIAACMFIYVQNDMDSHAVILPEARSAKLVIYNAMDSSVMISSSWTDDVILNAYTSRSFFVRGRGQLHTLMSVRNYEEGFEMRMTKAMNKANSRTSYTKTIFARELETTSYVISNLGLVKTANFKGKESVFYKTLSFRVARVLILSSTSWYLVPGVLYLKGAGTEVSLDLPELDGKKLIGLYQANYNFHIIAQSKTVSVANSSFEVESLASYTIIFYERRDEEHLRMLMYLPTNPKLRRFETKPIHFIGLYFLSLGLSILQIWLTRFIYSESSVATRCFLFAFFSLMWILGPSIYYLGLLIWRESTFMIVLLIFVVFYIFDFVAYTILTAFFQGQTWIDEKANLN